MLPLCMVGRRRLQAAHCTRLHTVPLAVICSCLANRFPSKPKPDDGTGRTQVPSLLTLSGQWGFPVLLSPVYLFPVQTPILLFSQSHGIPHGNIKFICLNNRWMGQQQLGAWKMKAVNISRCYQINPRLSQAERGRGSWKHVASLLCSHTLSEYPRTRADFSDSTPVMQLGACWNPWGR